MKEFKILNLYAGLGGNRKLWDKPLQEKYGNNFKVTAVELNPEIAAIYQDFYPVDFVVVDDAHQFLLENYKEFDFIWSSPPCPSHSRLNNFLNVQGVVRYPDMKLYQEILLLRHFCKNKFIIENVNPYYHPLIEPQKIDRHLVWANFKIPQKKIIRIENFIDANYSDLQNWLNIKMPKKIYLGNNNCHKQVLRNCMHPKLGLHILNRALEIKESENINQLSLFE